MIVLGILAVLEVTLVTSCAPKNSADLLPTMIAPTAGPIIPPTITPTLDPNPATLIPIDEPPPAIKQYASAPPLTIDMTGQYYATFKLAKGGEFVVQLFADKAPITVNSFVFLARDGFFNGTTFHRVLEGFMAQGGDPSGTGMSGPGYQFQNEDNDLKFDKAGLLAMANAGRDTNGSQFFITLGPAEWLNGGFTIFGQVISGMDVVNSIRLRDPDQLPNYKGDVIESITITEE
jgi:cyclophilin family peptidyl-prolyl cis-trans isomerase